MIIFRIHENIIPHSGQIFKSFSIDFVIFLAFLNTYDFIYTLLRFTVRYARSLFLCNAQGTWAFAGQVRRRARRVRQETLRGGAWQNRDDAGRTSQDRYAAEKA